jgi:hypothetical protein
VSKASVKKTVSITRVSPSPITLGTSPTTVVVEGKNLKRITRHRIVDARQKETAGFTLKVISHGSSAGSFSLAATSRVKPGTYKLSFHSGKRLIQTARGETQITVLVRQQSSRPPRTQLPRLPKR